MKKLVLMVVGLMLFASTAMAYDFGYLKIDPNVSLQKMTFSEWYGNKRPIFFGDKPEAALMWNKKDSTHGLLQLGFDVSGSKILALGPKSLFGLSLSGIDLADDEVGIALMYSQTVGGHIGMHSTQMSIDSDKKIEIESNEGITLTPGASSVIRFAGETNVDEVGLFTLTQEDVGATCTVGQMRFDTGGATEELCYCKATNTWACAALGAVAD